MSSNPKPGLSFLEGCPLNTQDGIPTAWERFLASVAQSPDNLALVSMHQPGSLFSLPSVPPPADTQPYLRWTYRSLKEGIDRLATALHALGVVAGMPIVTFLPQCAEYVLTKMAAHVMGCPFAPLNPRSLVNTDEVNHLVKLFLLHAPVKRAVFVAQDGQTARRIDALSQEYLGNAVKLVASGDCLENWVPFASVMTSSRSETAVFSTPSDETLLCTSGTTSVPKVCVWTTVQVAATLQIISQQPSGFSTHTTITNSTTGRTDISSTSNAADPPDADDKTADNRVDVINNDMNNIAANSIENPPSGIPTEETDKIIAVAPNNHVAGNEAILFSFSFGGTLIFPSPRFDIPSFWRAAVLEGATYTVLVPTMVLALCRSLLSDDASSSSNALTSDKVVSPDSSLSVSTSTQAKVKFRSLCLGGSPITTEVIRLCRDGLGCERVCPVFGSTEGAFVRSGDRPVQSLLGSESYAGYIAVGKGAAPGQTLKVCNPETGEILSTGEVGELHVSSPGMCTCYLGVENETFYLDSDGRKWYNTGDQARMDHQGCVYVLGRYKDVIIRGGENIAPAAIEAVLEPTLGHLEIQIVGVPDEDGIAGEVSVAITRHRADAETTARIRDTVVDKMGPAYAPDEVIALKDLGLENYPRTAVGKVQKSKLVELARAYRGRRDGTDRSQDSPSQSGTAMTEPDQLGATRTVPTEVLDHLTRIWSQAVGIYDETRYLPSETNVATLPVDSIVVMRVRDRVTKALGTTLSLAELSQAGTIHEQAVFLSAKLAATNPDNMKTTTGLGKILTEKPPQRNGPPEIDDMIHLTEDESLLEPTKQLIMKAIRPCGLSWDRHVRAVMPAQDFSMVSLRVGAMWHLNLKMVAVVRKLGATREDLRGALKRVIVNNPMMASFIVSDYEKLGVDLALHVQVDTTDQEFLDKYVLADGGTVRDISQMVDFAKQQHFPGCWDATPPGPLSKIWIFDVEDLGAPGFVLNACHSVYDATFTHLVLEDLESSLAKPTGSLRPHVDYKLWADSFYTLRSSPAARAAINYHTTALHGLHQHQHAIWPSHPPVYKLREIKFPANGELGVIRAFEVPGWTALRKNHPDIGASIPLKAAFALFLTRRTGHSHALFGQVESERGRWPFLPKSFGDMPATDVSGLTIQTVVNLTRIVPTEPVLTLLKRMQTAQTLQTKYASAPRAAVMAALGPEAGELFPWVASTATFNWLGANQHASRDQFKMFEVVDVVVSRGMFGFFLNGGMNVGPDGVTRFWFKLQGATFGTAELQEMAGELEELVKGLLEEGNWERVVGDILCSSL